MAFYMPKFTIYIQSKTKRIIEIKNPDHRNKDSRKYKKLQIWKLIDIKNIYHTMDEILEIGIKAVKNENRNISEAKTHKIWNIKKLVQGTRNRCEAKKWTKLIVLNYTERGKRQQIYNYFYIISILYTTIIFLHINLFFLYISVISEKKFFFLLSTKHNIHYCYNLHTFTEKI